MFWKFLDSLHVCPILYSEKQLKDINILLAIQDMRKLFPKKVIMYLIELPICISAECKIKFTGHW